MSSSLQCFHWQISNMRLNWLNYLPLPSIFNLSDEKSRPGALSIGFVAERVNDKASDILGCTSKSASELYIRRYSRLLDVLFDSLTTPNFRILALQRIIQHISQVIVPASSDTALAALVYLLTDMTLNIDAWTVDTIISLFNHAAQLALSMALAFQCLFAESLIETVRVLASNTLVYSFLW